VSASNKAAYVAADAAGSDPGAAVAVSVSETPHEHSSSAIPQVRGYLESVYKVSAQPEEYVKYRLHLVTRLEMRQINDWFHNRCAQPPLAVY